MIFKSLVRGGGKCALTPFTPTRDFDFEILNGEAQRVTSAISTFFSPPPSYLDASSIEIVAFF